MNISKVTLFKVILSFVIMMSFAACTDEENETAALRKNTEETSSETMVLGNKYPNPYNVNKMLETKDSLVKEGVITEDNLNVQATDYYVRFLPKDSNDLNKLVEEDLTLFDHPLDYEIVKQGDTYHDPSLSEEKITWQYTTVPVDYNFDRSIEYEILDTCFIPRETSEDEKETPLGILEVAAYNHVGLGEVFDFSDEDKEDKVAKTNNAKGLFPKGKKPEGYIKVNDDDNVSVGVKGVKVIVNTLVKWHSTHTDNNGHYKIKHKFYCGPLYTVQFSNEKQFDIWSNYLPIASIYVQGFHNKKGYSWTIKKSSSAWNLAAINNGAYDYFNWCASNNIKLPPQRTKLLTVGFMKQGFDCFFRRIDDYIPNHGYSGKAFKDFMFNVGVVAANVVQKVLKFGMPDIVIGTKNRTYKLLWKTTNHELAHGSHFSQVGSSYWSKDVSYILSCWANSDWLSPGEDTYGDGTLQYAGYCEVAEMWAYAIGNILAKEKFSDLHLYTGNMYWFKPIILVNIIRQEKILTAKQVYDCLTPDVKNKDLLKQALKNKRPDKADRIEELFAIDTLIGG